MTVADGNESMSARSAYLQATMANDRLYLAESLNRIWPDTVEGEPFFWELAGGDTIHPATVSWMEQLARRFSCPH